MDILAELKAIRQELAQMKVPNLFNISEGSLSEIRETKQNIIYRIDKIGKFYANSLNKNKEE